MKINLTQRDVVRSNQSWQCDRTRVDVLLVDSDGKLIGRPWLIAITDIYSRCVMGFKLEYEYPNSHSVALCLRHAILPKMYAEYELKNEWGTYGLPEYLYIHMGVDSDSGRLQQIGMHLGFVLNSITQLADMHTLERMFNSLNREAFAGLPGYMGSNSQIRSKDPEAEASLTLQELDKILVRYIVDCFNQGLDARIGDRTSFQTWESGLISIPKILTNRELDILLTE